MRQGAAGSTPSAALSGGGGGLLAASGPAATGPPSPSPSPSPAGRDHPLRCSVASSRGSAGGGEERWPARVADLMRSVQVCWAPGVRGISGLAPVMHARCHSPPPNVFHRRVCPPPPTLCPAPGPGGAAGRGAGAQLGPAAPRVGAAGAAAAGAQRWTAQWRRRERGRGAGGRCSRRVPFDGGRGGSSLLMSDDGNCRSPPLWQVSFTCGLGWYG